MEGQVIGGKWRLVHKYGLLERRQEVYQAVNVNDDNDWVAVKLEEIQPGHAPTLANEFDVYNSMLPSQRGFASILYYGETESGTHLAIVIILLGPSLRGLFLDYNKELSTKTVLMIAIQGLKRIKYLHGQDFVHGDIKPSNMAIGHPDRDRIYLIDFGISKKFYNTNARAHIPYSEGHRIPCTRQYASINVQKGVSSTRRDDLESFGYTLIKLFKGSLPWGNSTDDHEMLFLKEATPFLDICEEAPSSMVDYFNHVRNLRFNERPDYDFLMRLFEGSMERRGLVNDRLFDWMEPSSSSSSSSSPSSSSSSSSSSPSSSSSSMPVTSGGRLSFRSSIRSWWNANFE